MISQLKLKKMLNYDPDTGVFTRIVVNNNRWKVGSVAGTPTNGYIRIRVEGITYAAHHLAFLYMLGAFPAGKVWHKNAKRDDNSWSNLKPEIKQLNTGQDEAPTEGNVVGVRRLANKWNATVWVKGKDICLGYFADRDAAIDARNLNCLNYGLGL